MASAPAAARSACEREVGYGDRAAHAAAAALAGGSLVARARVRVRGSGLVRVHRVNRVDQQAFADRGGDEADGERDRLFDRARVHQRRLVLATAGLEA